MIQSEDRTGPRRQVHAVGPVRWWIRRALWLLAALVHVQAIVRAIGAGESEAQWLRAVVLLAGMAFCLLKVADVAAVRLKPGWRPRLVGLLTLVLIHVGMVPALHDSVADVWAAGTASTTALVWIRPGFAHVLKRLDRARRNRTRLILPLVGLTSDWLLPIHRLPLCRLIATPRAPPLAA